MIIFDDGRAIELRVSVRGIVSLGASLAVMDFGCVMVTAHLGCNGVPAVHIREQLNHGDMAFHLYIILHVRSGLCTCQTD